MRPRLSWILIAPLSILLLLTADRIARQAARAGGHSHQLMDGEGAGFVFPTLRALLVHGWLIRIDADLRAGRLTRALRHAREALAIAPDLSRARIRLSFVLAYEMAMQTTSAEERLGWIAEGLAVLDEGIERTPHDGLLHNARGHLIWTRGIYVDGFAEAFAEAYGRSTLEAGVDALVRGAEYAHGTTDLLLHAAIGLEVRADDFVDHAIAGEHDRLELARADFERAIGYLRQILEFSGRPPASFERDLEYATVSLELIELNQRLLEREPVDLDRIAELRQRRLELKPGAE